MDSPRIAVFCDNRSLRYHPAHLSFTHLVAAQSDVDVYMTRGRDDYTRTYRLYPFRHFDFRNDSYDYLSRFSVEGIPYDHMVAFDPFGLKLCKCLFPDAQPIYYSCELYNLDDPFYIAAGHESRELPWIESQLLPDTTGLIIQSETRARIFREVHPEYDRSVFILPLVHAGEGQKKRTPYCHQRYKIPEDFRILVHLGLPYKSDKLDEIMLQIQGVKDWCLLIHGERGMAYRDELESLVITNGYERVFFTNEFFDELGEADDILAGADAGYAWLNGQNMINRETAGFSSGRIVNYLKHGLPVLTNGYPDFREAIEQPGCGECIDQHTEIPAALNRIGSNLEVMSQAALDEYEKRYRFEHYRDDLYAFLQNHSPAVSKDQRVHAPLERLALSSLLGRPLKALMSDIEGREIFLWGAGLAGEMMGELLLRYGFTDFAYLDSDQGKVGKQLHDRPIFHPDEKLRGSGNKPFILITSVARHVIGHLLKQKGFKVEHDFHFLYP